MATKIGHRRPRPKIDLGTYIEYDVFGREDISQPAGKARNKFATVRELKFHYKGKNFSAWEIVSPNGHSTADLDNLHKFLATQLTDETVLKKNWIDVWTSTPEKMPDLDLSNYNTVAAAFMLYMALVGWAVTGISDNPSQTLTASQMIQSTEDLSVFARMLLSGVTVQNAYLLSPAEDDNTATADLLRNLKGDVIAAGKTKNAKPTDLITWSELGRWLPYELLLQTAIENTTRSTLKAARRLADQVPSQPMLAVVEQALRSLATHFTYS